MQSKTQVRSQTAQRITAPRAAWVGWTPLLVLPTIVVLFGFQIPAWAFMWLLAVALFAGLKWVSWWRVRSQVVHRPWRSVAYLLGWPGMDAEAFLDEQRQAARPRAVEWLWAVVKTLAGIALIWIIARRAQMPLAQGWTGLLGLVLLLHFGSFHLIALFWQSMGVVAQPIMAKPILSKTLSEFWGKRWNLGFRQLAHDLIFQPLHRKIGVAAAGLLVFLTSGLVHDLVISVPARGGYGLPTGYFVLQGLGVMLERSALGQGMGLQRGIGGWMFMVIVAAGPAFWLFHPPFVMRVILPFMRVVHAL